jgi:endonuclease YncB( thermonuclease family)
MGWRTVGGGLIMVLFAGAAGADISGPARIVDGDTIEIDGETIRLYGIDAPELDQTCERGGAAYFCGVVATDWLVERTDGAMVTCRGEQRDRYGRRLAICRAGGIDLNAGLVRAGWAVAFRRYSQRYVADEAIAKRDGSGMWSGEFTDPTNWRRAKRGQSEIVLVMEDCTIKGNVNGGGERIYHRPSGRYYESVRIRPWEGDRCFQTEQEAQEAGFRAAAR